MNSGFLATTQINPTVVDWSNRVKANGGLQPQTKTIVASSRFVNTTYSYGLSSSLHTFVNFADTLSASLTPLIRTTGSLKWVPTGIQFTDAHLDINGLQGATGRYINTGLFVNNFSDTGSNMLLCYVTNDDTSSTQTEIGCSDSGTSNNRLYPHYNDAKTYYSSFRDSAQISSPATNSFYTGLVMGVKVATTGTTQYIYKGNSSLGFITVVTGSTNLGTVPAIRPLYVFATNEAGSVTNTSKKKMSCVGMGRGLMIDKASQLYTAIQQLRVDLGGGYA